MDAVAVWGGQRVPLAGVPVEVAGRTVTVPATLQLAPGEYRVTPGAVPGATAEARTGRVTDGAGGRVTLEYAVRADLSMLVSPDLVDACDVTTLTVTARTDFPYRLPSGLKLDLPNGWTSDYPRELRGDLSSSSPLRLRTPVRVCRGDAAQASLENTALLATGEARVRNPPGATVSRVMAGSNVRLTKSVASAETGYVVTLVLTADSVVENLRVLDPLPSGGSTPALRGQLTVQGPTSGAGLAGATPRLDGDTLWLGRVTPGQYTLTYTLFTDVGPERVVTAPELLW